MDIRYPANSINLPHKTQTQPKEEVHQIGARAPDGPLLHLLPSASDLPSDNDAQALAACKEQRVFVQELTVGVGRFHILVFVGNSLSNLALFKARELELAQRIEEYLLQWRAQWHYTLSRDDNTDGQLVKVHVIATGDTSESHGKGLLAQRAQGDGRLFWDSSAEVHASYGVPVLAKDQGAIVVIRPDSHIGFRVRGLDKGAWEDVAEYLQTILV